MTKQKTVIIKVGSDDIYFIINNKETSILKMMDDLEKKVTKFALGGWLALGLTIVVAVPMSIFQVGLLEVKEQNAELDKQNEVLDKQNAELSTQKTELNQQINILENRLIILETEFKNK